MVGNKLTCKDVKEHCKNNECNNCEYMDKYCHIREFLIDECDYCEKNNCKGCKYYI